MADNDNSPHFPRQALVIPQQLTSEMPESQHIHFLGCIAPYLLPLQSPASSIVPELDTLAKIHLHRDSPNPPSDFYIIQDICPPLTNAEAKLANIEEIRAKSPNTNVIQTPDYRPYKTKRRF